MGLRVHWFLLVSFIYLQVKALCSLTKDHVQRKRKFRKNGSSLTFSSLRRELREGYLHALLGGSSLNYTGNSEPDPLISSFMCNAPPVDQPPSVESHPPVEACPAKDLSKEELGERYEL